MRKTTGWAEVLALFLAAAAPAWAGMPTVLTRGGSGDLDKYFDQAIVKTVIK